jgi:dihydroxyacetone kinase-like protein
MTLISTVGGTSGPLYGTAFMRAAAALTNRGDHIAEPEIVLALDAALEGIQARGKATRNEKTMVDALAPMLDLLHETAASDEPFLHRFRRAVAAAEEGMRATVPMLAKKGRASYLGERSIGHQDPGATSSFYLVRAMLETLEEVEA